MNVRRRRQKPAETVHIIAVGIKCGRDSFPRPSGQRQSSTTRPQRVQRNIPPKPNNLRLATRGWVWRCHGTSSGPSTKIASILPLSVIELRKTMGTLPSWVQVKTTCTKTFILPSCPRRQKTAAASQVTNNCPSNRGQVSGDKLF